VMEGFMPAFKIPLRVLFIAQDRMSLVNLVYKLGY